MADGVRRDEWERASWQMSVTSASGMGGRWVDPKQFNPYFREPPKTPEQEASESRQAFAMLGMALADLSGT
jgi:hypothetical protein